MAEDKILRMANQIARFMESRPEAQGIEGVAAHINDFWEPRMRGQLLARLEGAAEAAHPLVSKAAPLIRRP